MSTLLNPDEVYICLDSNNPNFETFNVSCKILNDDTTYTSETLDEKFEDDEPVDELLQIITLMFVNMNEVTINEYFNNVKQVNTNLESVKLLLQEFINRFEVTYLKIDTTEPYY